MVQITQKFERFLDAYRRPDGSSWEGRIENSGFEKLLRR